MVEILELNTDKMKSILNTLFNHNTLSQSEAAQVIAEIGSGTIPTEQIAAFMTVFNMRPPRLDEMLGFREALLDLCVKIDFNGVPIIDLCGTGGDGKDSFNISTTSSFIVAAAGQPVAKHGNYGVSSLCGSSNVLESIGVKFTNDESLLKRQLDATNICILHAPLFHPAMKAVGPVRKNLQVKTFFNMLGPLVNPARPLNQLTGTFNLELARMYQYIMQKEGNMNFGILHGLDGYDEISLTSDTRILAHTGEFTVSPSDLNCSRVSAQDISGGKSIEDAKEILLSVLKGHGSQAQQDVVYANSGVALFVSGKARSLQDGVELAKETVLSGEAYRTFVKFLELQG